MRLAINRIDLAPLNCFVKVARGFKQDFYFDATTHLFTHRVVGLVFDSFATLTRNTDYKSIGEVSYVCPLLVVTRDRQCNQTSGDIFCRGVPRVHVD